MPIFSDHLDMKLLANGCALHSGEETAHAGSCVWSIMRVLCPEMFNVHQIRMKVTVAKMLRSF